MSFKKLEIICVLLIPCITTVLCEICLEEPGNIKKCNGLLHEEYSIKKADAEILLTLHQVYQRNTYRNKTSFPAFEWDPDLIYQARYWARQCIDSDNKCRSLGKYKRVYQLTKKSFHGTFAADINLSKIIQEWFQELTDPKDDSKRAAIRFDIVDRIGCGFAVAQKTGCKHQKMFCGGHGYSSYLVCRFASTSENENTIFTEDGQK